MRKRVLLVGLRSDVVDYAKWPELTPEKLEAAFQSVLSELEDAGYKAEWCLTDTGETARAQLKESLKSFEPEVVLIGAGVRKDEGHFLLFEEMINVVHELAPNARITFNTLPYDSVAAVQRWSKR